MIRPLAEPLNRPCRLAVLISGGGTTLVNLAECIADGSLNAEVATVVASRPCRGIERATEANLPCELRSRRGFDSVESFSDAVFDVIRAANVDLVILGGFLSLLRIPDDFRDRVLNIHPSLIPAFCGRGYHGSKVHEAVLEYGAKVTGCTVHFADNTYDTGPIVLQRAVPVHDDDTPETLAARVFEAECEAYPEAIRLFAEGRLTIDGRVVRIQEDEAALARRLQFEFETTEAVYESCCDICSLMAEHFRIPLDEAVGRVNRHWRGNGFTSRMAVNCFYHESTLFWAKQIYFADSADGNCWWHDEANARPKPYP